MNNYVFITLLIVGLAIVAAGGNNKSKNLFVLIFACVLGGAFMIFALFGLLKCFS